MEPNLVQNFLEKKLVQTEPHFSQVFEIHCQNRDRTLVKLVQTGPPFSQVFEICCQNRDRTLVKMLRTESENRPNTWVYDLLSTGAIFVRNLD